MKRTTFGSFPAARILQARLERLGDEGLQRKISRFLNDFNEGLHELFAIESSKHRVRFALLWRNDFLARVDFHPDLDGYVKNVLSTYYKDIFRTD